MARTNLATLATFPGYAAYAAKRAKAQANLNLSTAKIEARETPRVRIHYQDPQFNNYMVILPVQDADGAIPLLPFWACHITVWVWEDRWQDLPPVFEGNIALHPAYQLYSPPPAYPESENLCKGCVYATGEALLPCGVNPLAFGQGCRDYTV